MARGDRRVDVRSVLLVAMFPLACRGLDAVPPVDPMIPALASEDDLIVARVGEIPILASDLAREMRQLAGTAGDSAQALRERALAKLIAFELLAVHAQRRGHLAAARGSETTRSAMVERLIERLFEPGTGRSDVPEAEIRKLYEKGKDDFVRPRLVDIGALVVYTGELMKPGPRAERTETARQLAARLADRPPGSLAEFVAVAQDPAWKTRHVVYRRMLQGGGRPLTGEVDAAVARLRVEGELTPLVEDESGFYIARYIAEQPARNIGFAEAREGLIEAFYPRWRQDRFLKFAKELGSGHEIEAFPEQILASAR